MNNVVEFQQLPELSPMGQRALEYAQAGLYVFPVWGLLDDLGCACPEHGNCGSPGKHPMVKSGLNVATTALDQITKWWRKWPKANIGINADKSGLLILDVDPRNGGNESLERLEKENGDLPPTYEVHTGGDGRHFYFKHSPAVKSKPIAAGIDIKSKGGYVVAPPSIHHSGRNYEATLAGNPRGFILDAPEWVVELCTREPEKQKKESRATKPGQKPAKQVPVESGLYGAALKHAGWLGDYVGVGRCACKCPFESSHTTGNSCDGSTVVFAPENGGINGYIHCSHSHCANRSQPDFWKAIPAASRDFARVQLQVNTLYEPAATADVEWCKSWRSSLLFDTKGKLKRVLGNASLILKNHPDFAGCLGYDEFKESYMWLKKPPSIVGLDDIPLGPVKDGHFLQIGYYLSARYDMQEFSSDNIFQIMRGAAIPFHPVRDYLNSLVWDQKPRLVNWLCTYLGCENSRYCHLVGPMWFVSGVARIAEPGCKADHVLILEGKQGTQKSTALRLIFQPWFADTPINLDSKDAYTALRGIWGYELQELQSLSKADTDKAKAFFSSPVDVYRKPYDRTTVEIKRQCIFCGTVNYDVYLKDGSGNRRYLPVATGKIDIPALERDRDQLWAEAVEMYNKGFKWYPETDEDSELFEGEQEKRLQLDEDPWTENVRDAVKDLTHCSISQLLNDPIHFPNCKRDIKDAIRVTRILRELGWEKYQSANGRAWRRINRNENERKALL